MIGFCIIASYGLVIINVNYIFEGLSIYIRTFDAANEEEKG